MEKFSVLIPAYNEEKNIILTITETIKVFEDFKKDYEIIVIDDGSTDNTCNLVKKNLPNFNNKVKLESCSPNKGKGYALKYGFNFASGDYVLFLDADLDLHPSQLVNLYNLMMEKNADVVIGSKLNKSSSLNYPAIRKFLSKGYYIFIKVLFHLPLKDTQTGLKLFKYEVLKNSINKLKVDKYAFDLELLAIINKYGCKIIESPVTVKSKRKHRKIGLKDIFNIALDTIRIFYRLNIKKSY